MVPARSFSRPFVILFAAAVLQASAFSGYKTEYTVAADGSGDFSRIQAAIDDCKSFPDLPITIRVKEGRYREKVTVHAWNTNLTILGLGEVIIAYNSHFKEVNRGRNSTFFTGTVEVLANDFSARNLTIENTAGPVGQAIALRVEGDRCSFFDCRLIGNQDTLYLAGEGHRQYFENCYIEGTTDYIFGGATAFFQNCILMSKADSYISAASTPKSSSFGFVFNKCRLDAAKGITEVYLGRPWRKHAKTVYLGCDYGDFIAQAGWDDWGLEDPGASVFYAEYIPKGSKKTGKRRIAWSCQLSKSDLSDYSREKVLRGWTP
ncbi:Pectinesterase superfamily [Verrucomicrobiia bacterium DG1235]|nr:Pectinesterase superfamily [Verrucomicrobiae bacterium DG1235]